MSNDKLTNKWVKFWGNGYSELHVFIDDEGCVQGDMELLGRLGYNVTDEIENSDSNMLNNYYDGVTVEDLQHDYGFTESRLMADDEISEAIHRMPDAISAYAEQDLKAAYKMNGIEHLYKAEWDLVTQ